MSIRVSKKYGVNPTIPKCFYCLKDKNEILLLGKTKGDKETPKGAVWDHEPCDECKDWMKKGIICISVDPSKSTDRQNPWRSGGWSVLKEEVIKRLSMSEEMQQKVLKARYMFVEDQVWDLFGIPKGDVDEKAN